MPYISKKKAAEDAAFEAALGEVGVAPVKTKIDSKNVFFVSALFSSLLTGFIFYEGWKLSNVSHIVVLFFIVAFVAILLADASHAIAATNLSQLQKSKKSADPVAEAIHSGAGTVALVYWVVFGLLASYVCPNFLALFQGASAGKLHASTEGLITAGSSALIPAVLLALYGRKKI